MTLRRRGAFTLVETVVATLLACGLVALLIALLSATTTGFARAQRRADREDGARRALAAVRFALQDALAYQLAPDRLRFRTARGDAELTLDHHRLLFRAPGQPRASTLLSGVELLRMGDGRHAQLSLTIGVRDARPAHPGLHTESDAVWMPALADP